MGSGDRQEEDEEASEMSGAMKSDREIHTTRVLSASREQVFSALTDPKILQHWWGPNGFTNTFHAFELKPDGLWEFTMHGPNGQDFHNTCIFKRIEAPSYLEFDHLKEMHFYKAFFKLTEIEGSTLLEWIMRFNTAEELTPIRPFITVGNEENLEKLQLELDQLS